jgi:acetyl/propionyl-CoA carboxylase alpha subunit
MMGEAALKAAKTVNYTNAGTVEFLYQDGEFYFLEMNTRLQVEHGVTEMVCGIDIVKWQLKVANGESLDFQQKDIKQRGHSIECRIYAEDPSRDFLPTPGVIRRLVLPEGPGIRNDIGVLEGQEVSSAYDPLLAKLVVWDSCRNSAINRMDHALSDFVIMGLITNQPFLRDIMNNDSYRKASFTTKFVDEEFSEWSLDLQSPVVAAAAMLASSSDNQKAVTESSRDPYSPWSSRGGWRQGV